MKFDGSLIQLEDIESIEFVGPTNMVDISVEEDESFVLRNGLISHNSAISGMASVRDSKIHGGLPLRGKVLNVNGEPPKRVLESQALVDIITALGLVVGEPADRSKLRYGRVYIATDSDQDGANICALLVNFLYTYWPELFSEKEPPFVFVFMTPFIIAEKGNQRKYWYAHNYAEFKPEDWKGWAITRAKGLGTLQEPDWQHSLDHPVLYPIVDDGKMKESLDLVFNGDRAGDRKVWIGI